MSREAHNPLATSPLCKVESDLASPRRAHSFRLRPEGYGGQAVGQSQPAPARQTVGRLCVGAGRQGTLRPDMYTIYLLIGTESGRRYVGLTNNADRRLAEHNSGKVRSTQAYRPYRLIVLRQHTSLEDARRSEKYFKSGFGRKHIGRVLKYEHDPDLLWVKAEEAGLTHRNSADLRGPGVAFRNHLS